MTSAAGLEGYEAEIRYLGGSLRCGDCTATRTVDQWQVDEVRTTGPSEVVAAARCPRCGAAGLLVVDDVDSEPGLGLVLALERGAG